MARASTAAALAAIALAGCGGGSSTTAPGTTTASTPPATTTSTPKQPAGPSRSGRSGGQSTRSGGGSPPPPAPTNDPQSAIDGALASTDPSVACHDDVTQAFRQKSYGNPQACAQAVESGAAADSVRVQSVQVSGSQATAKAIPVGGPSAGDHLTVFLVVENGAWKVDSLKSSAPVGP